MSINNLADCILSKSLISRAAEHGLVFEIKKTNPKLIESPRNDSSSTWVGVDFEFPSRNKVGCYGDEINYIDNYIKNILKTTADKVVLAEVYHARRLSDNTEHYSLSPDFGLGYRKSEQRSFIYEGVESLLARKNKLANSEILEDFDYQVKLFSDANCGDVYDLYITDLSGKNLDEILIVYNTDGEAVENYCEDMLDLVVNQYFGEQSFERESVAVPFSFNGTKHGELSDGTIECVLKSVKSAIGDSFIVGDYEVFEDNTKSKIHVAIDSIPLFSSINHKSKANMFDWTIDRLMFAGIGRYMNMTPTDITVFLAGEQPYKKWDRYFLSVFISSLLDYAADEQEQALASHAHE